MAAEPERHARAARAIAEAYFDSDRVLPRLLEQALNRSSRRPAPAARP